MTLWSRFFYFRDIFGRNLNKPHITSILKTFDWRFRIESLDIRLALASIDTACHHFISVGPDVLLSFSFTPDVEQVEKVVDERRY